MHILLLKTDQYQVIAPSAKPGKQRDGCRGAPSGDSTPKDSLMHSICKEIAVMGAPNAGEKQEQHAHASPVSLSRKASESG